MVFQLKAGVNQDELADYFGSSTILAVFILLLFLDILVNANTAYFDRGAIFIDRLSIIKHYFRRSGGWTDILLVIALV